MPECCAAAVESEDARDDDWLGHDPVMIETVPAFPLAGEPETWDELTLLAATVFLEAEGEPAGGKHAVGWVIRNRMGDAKTVHDVVLAPWQFSCWNADYRMRARARLSTAARPAACWTAAASALWRLSSDPTRGADHYLNPELTKRIRPQHDLPEWYDPTRVTLTVGQHEFLRLG